MERLPHDPDPTWIRATRGILVPLGASIIATIPCHPARRKRARPLQPPREGTSLSSYKYDAETICDEIIDMLDQLKLDKVHFLGESTSGMIGEILAVKYPDRLHSLIICSSPTYLPPAATEMFAFGHEDWPTACRQLGARGWAEQLSKIPGTVSVPDPGYLQWWIDQISLSNSEGLAGYAQFLTTLDARPYLSEIKIPMLILAPANSAATTVEEQKGIQRLVQGAEMEVIHGKGHEIYVDKAEECQASVLSFLSRLSGSKS